MLSSVLKKLLADLRLLVSRKVPESDWNLDSLLGIVEEEIVAQERVESKPSQPLQRQRSERSVSTATALVASVNLLSPLVAIVSSHTQLIAVQT